LIVSTVRWCLRYDCQFVTLRSSSQDAGSMSITSRATGGCNASHHYSSAQPGRAVKVTGLWRYVYRAVDQHGQLTDIYVSKRSNLTAPRTFFTSVLPRHDRHEEVTIDLAASLLRVVDDPSPGAARDTEQYSNNRIENDHGRLKARLRPMRWPRIHAEPAARPLRTWRRSPPRTATRRHSIRRTRRSNLTGLHHQTLAPRHPIDQRNRLVSSCRIGWPTERARTTGHLR
jgi:hypothetical protein